MATDDKLLALCEVAAAAALRSHAALWAAAERALESGAVWDEVEAAVRAAVIAAGRAVEEEALPTLREVWARQGARDRWDLSH